MATFKYQKIIDDVIAQIESGSLKHRLPSVRKLAQQKQLGVSTIVQAYHELERLGWIVAKPKQGYFVKGNTRLSEPTMAPNYGRQINRVVAGLSLDEAVQYSFNDPAILPLSCTAPSTALDCELLLNKLHKQAIKRRPYKLWMQDPIEGIAELRHAICMHLQSSGQHFTADNVLITNGRQEGLMVALHAALALKAPIAVESPMSFYFQATLKQFNADVIEVPMQHNFDDELALLTATYQREPFSTYLVNPNFADPTGRVLSEQQKLQLIDWAVAHEVTLIEYDRGELYFGHQRPKTLACLVPADSPCKLISIADFYDTVSPTISLGYLLCVNTVEACQFTKQVLAEEPSIALQFMLLQMLESGQYRKHLVQLRQQIRFNYAQTISRLQGALAGITGSDLYVSQPEGGPCLWFKLPDGRDSRQLWQYLIEHKLAIAPGRMFSLSANYDDYFRITYALPWDDNMQQGVAQFAQLLVTFLNSP
ncbi:PLP-dependent aminotransferase family protein [Shewanella waksmanii]|uniref:aminotransferase-like domain-containing protein n=1 Tax=Shewanella waksmanii TaxID=213783 RepID=UPI003736A731